MIFTKINSSDNPKIEERNQRGQQNMLTVSELSPDSQVSTSSNDDNPRLTEQIRQRRHLSKLVGS